MRHTEDQSRLSAGPLQPALQAGEERFRALIEAGADGVLVVGRDGTIAFANPAACALMGRAAADLVGQPFGVPVVPGETTEVDIPRGDGTVRVAEMRTAAATWHGEPAYLAALRDVTERKRTETEREHHLLRERERTGQLRKLAEISARLNAAHDVGSVLGVITEEARHLLGAHHAITSLTAGPEGTQVITVVSLSEEYQRRRDGGAATDGLGIASLVFGMDRVTLGGIAAPLVGRNGRKFGLIRLTDKEHGAFTEDDEAILGQLAQVASVAVENARLYQELRENDRRKDEFLAMLAHELRNPLAAISNAVTLTTQSRVQDQIDWAMEVIGRQIRHLTRMIDDLLDISRITRGKIELRRQRLNVAPVIASAVQAVRPLAEARKHQIAVSAPDAGLWVEADPVRLEQILTNLLTNAAKYTESSGHITLDARRDGGDVVFAVADDGMGIPPEKLPQMFELFAQGERSIARSEGGLGIGLTLVKRLVELHGGSVEARSDGPGRGSEFIVRLPAVEGPRAMPPPDPGAGRSSATRATRILVVDDNADMARSMARLLKLLGHDVRTAHDGPQAIRAALDHRPEFVLLDIGLPGMDGYQVAARLRREEALEGVVIVAVSGYGQEEDRRRSREAGFDHHLVKPLDHDALLALLAKVGPA